MCVPLPADMADVAADAEARLRGAAERGDGERGAGARERPEGIPEDRYCPSCSLDDYNVAEFINPDLSYMLVRYWQCVCRRLIGITEFTGIHIELPARAGVNSRAVVSLR